MTTERVSGVWKRATIVLGLLVVTLGVFGHCRPNPGHPDPELARAVREAVEMARATQERNDVAHMAAGRNRLAAIALGVTVPIAGAVVLVVIVCRIRPENLGRTGASELQTGETNDENEEEPYEKEQVVRQRLHNGSWRQE